MAEFSATGLAELMLSLQEVAQIPDDVQDDMLNAEADVAVAAQRKKVRAYGIYDGRSAKHVADSLKKGDVKVKDGARAIYITPTGSRKRGKLTTRNAEILFVNEYGRKNQRARPALRDASEECADAAVQAAFEIYDRYLQSKNL